VIDRIRDALAPPRAAQTGDTGYRRLLRWASLPVTDRRWAAPLAALALGFGIFAGVAIGPGAAGTFATGAPQIIEVPGFSGGTDGGSGGGDGGSPIAAAPESSESLGGEENGGGESSASFAPVAPLEEEVSEPAGEEGSPSPAAAPKAEEEPAQPEKQELTGTVVHVNPAAGSYTVAEAGGVMSAVHAGKLPAPGIAVEVPIKALANGTLGEAGTRRKTATKAVAEPAGIVTFVNPDPAAPAYAISNRGSSVLVRVQPDANGAPPPLPVLGAYGTVQVAIEAGVLWQRQLSAGGAPFTHADLEGIVAAVDLETARLTISADDVRESGQDIVLAIPSQIDATALAAGDSVLASADIAADGTLTLTGLASDERLKGAEDTAATQGDLVPEKPKGER
jgi:hypothetical protein